MWMSRAQTDLAVNLTIAGLVLIAFPVLLVIFSARVSGWQKMIWTLVMLGFSWLGYAAFEHRFREADRQR